MTSFFDTCQFHIQYLSIDHSVMFLYNIKALLYKSIRPNLNRNWYLSRNYLKRLRDEHQANRRSNNYRLPLSKGHNSHEGLSRKSSSSSKNSQQVMFALMKSIKKSKNTTFVHKISELVLKLLLIKNTTIYKYEKGHIYTKTKSMQHLKYKIY